MKSPVRVAVEISILVLLANTVVTFTAQPAEILQPPVVGAPSGERPADREPAPGAPAKAPDAQAESPEERSGPFPIRVRYEVERDFGYHIGDEVPVVVVLTIEPGTIVDLVKLPGVGDFHGPFQVRRLKIELGQEGGLKTYRIRYVVQLFRPSLAVDEVKFPPLEILFARSQSHLPPGGYRYRSLLAPAQALQFSRTASYSSTMRGIKGPLADPRLFTTWGAFGLGLFLLAFAGGNWGLDVYRRRRDRNLNKELAPVERALASFREAQHKYLIEDDNVSLLFAEVSRVLRSFLSEVYPVHALNQTPEQIRASFSDNPRQVEIFDVLKCCNQILYEGHEPSAFEREQIMNRLGTLVVDLSCENGASGRNGKTNHGNGHDAPG